MIDFIQMFKSAAYIEKPNYDAASRQKAENWGNIISKTGYMKAGKITLPITSKDDPTIKNPGLVIVQDINNFDGASMRNPINNLQLKGFTTASKSCHFEVFTFIKTESGDFDLWLNYSNIIGIPKRENHKIAVLRPGKAIRFKINGKSDFTMTGRKQRTFAVFDYIIEFLGSAESIEFAELNHIETKKELPDCKLIDERKLLF